MAYKIISSRQWRIGGTPTTDCELFNNLVFGKIQTGTCRFDLSREESFKVPEGDFYRFVFRKSQGKTSQQNT